jgi:hypothetical protein
MRHAFVTIVMTLIAPVAVHAAGLRAGVCKLLDAGATGTPLAVKAAREQYTTLKRAHPKNDRLDCVYGLVLVNQHRYLEGIQLLSTYLKPHDDDPSVARTIIWAQLQARQYAAGLDAAVSESVHFPADGGQPRQNFVESAEFLGAVFGYFELARPTAIEPHKLTTAKELVLSRVSDTYIPALDRGRETISAKIEQLERVRTLEAEQKQAARDAFTSQQQAALDDARERMTAQRDALAVSGTQLSRAQRDTQILYRELTSLRQDRIRLGVRITFLQEQMQRSASSPVVIDQDTSALQATVAYKRNLKYAQVQGLWMQLAVLNKQAFDMDQRISALELEVAQLTGKQRGASQAIADNEVTAAEADRQARTIERRLDRDRAKSSKANRAIKSAGRTLPFSAFVPFPYEQEKARVLAWFAE